MVHILIKKHSPNSRIPIEKQNKDRHIHKKDLIQPRYEGELNPDYIRTHGTKNLNISLHDIKKTKNLKMERYLTEQFIRQQKEKGNENTDK